MLARDYRRLRSDGLPLGTIGGRRAIVGRSGKYIRKSRSGSINIVTTPPDVETGRRLDESAIGQEVADP